MQWIIIVGVSFIIRNLFKIVGRWCKALTSTVNGSDVTTRMMNRMEMSRPEDYKMVQCRCCVPLGEAHSDADCVYLSVKMYFIRFCRDLAQRDAKVFYAENVFGFNNVLKDSGSVQTSGSRLDRPVRAREWRRKGEEEERERKRECQQTELHTIPPHPAATLNSISKLKAHNT